MNQVQDLFAQLRETVSLLEDPRHQEVMYNELDRVEALATWYGLKDAVVTETGRLSIEDFLHKVNVHRTNCTIGMDGENGYEIRVGSGSDYKIYRGPDMSRMSPFVRSMFVETVHKRMGGE
jgi:hypothetical protein